MTNTCFYAVAECEGCVFVLFCIASGGENKKAQDVFRKRPFHEVNALGGLRNRYAPGAFTSTITVHSITMSCLSLVLYRHVQRKIVGYDLNLMICDG